LQIILNGQRLTKVVIDAHYEMKHSKSINDELILELVRLLNGRTLEFETVSAASWEIYVYDPLYLGGRPYRMVFCTHQEERILGVINAFRR
jgi:hypothetical protein